MKLEMEVISTETVKPSSPTPQHLRHYNLSLLDQIAPQVNTSTVFFFKANDITNKFNTKEASNILKKSLSQVLTHYYPFAGRLIVNKSLVDCNDQGVPFMETKVQCHLSHVIEDPSPANLTKLLPYDMHEAVDSIIGVQFNTFDCGGIAIGVCLSHKIGDALSGFHFIKIWFATARGEPQQIIKTHFQSSSLFPPKKDMPGCDGQSTSNIEESKIVCKRFVFEASIIEYMRTKYSKKPTSRIAALSNFLWTRFVAATNEEERKKIIHLVGWTANLRPRMDPPLPEYAFGNYSWYFRTFPKLDEQGKCNDDFGELLKEEINKMDNDFIVRLREGKEWNPVVNKEELGRAIEEGGMVVFSFTSLCRLPMNEVDFGWGNPTLVVPTIWNNKNLVTLKDTMSDGGIEAYVSLTEDDMAKFERDVELLAHVSTTH